MGNERVEGYADGFRIGWDKAIEFVKNIPESKFVERGQFNRTYFDKAINDPECVNPVSEERQ